VDSRRCLSYHTIELRGAFPAEHREAAASRVFGCDDCQSACPWNRGDDPGEILPELRPRPGLAAPDLVELLSMPLSGYTERFRGSSLKRATYQGLRRNAAIALGNVLAGGAALDGRPAVSDADRARAIEALEAAAADDEASVAEAAAWALRAVRG
jgi:epoxyqueuosine reductase